MQRLNLQFEHKFYLALFTLLVAFIAFAWILAESILRFKPEIQESSLADLVAGLPGDFVLLLLIAIAAVMAITSLFMMYLVRKLKKDLAVLDEGAMAFKGGTLSGRIPDVGDFGLQKLGDALNTMAQQLTELHEQLREAEIQMERSADEKTLELQQTNKKLAESDAKRRKLLADISHEIRTPLTVIRGEAELALRNSANTEMNNPTVFQLIIDQAEHTRRLADDLLFIARVDAGEPRLQLSSVSIAGIMDSVCQEISARAENLGIGIVQGRAPTGAVVRGDSGRLRQVFTILLDNALRYSDKGDRIDVQILLESGGVKVVVQDQGIGMTGEESELVFERFYRAPGAVEKADGTGLGLPVARAIVESHNGTISLSGTPGQGAIATVVLPFGRQFGDME